MLTGLASLLIWVALAGGTQPFDTYETVVAADSPVAQYKLSDTSGSSTLADSAGTNTASNTGITLGGEGPFGGSKSGAFGGSAYASLTSNPLAGASAFTAEAWVNWTGGASYKQPIFDFGSNSTNYMYLTPAGSSSSHKMVFEIHTTLFSAQLNAPKLKSGSWQYVAVTETTGGKLTLYVNGVNEAEITSVGLHPSSLPTTTGNYLGKSLIAEDPSFNGAMSNVAFYTTALSQSRIEVHYHAGEFPVNTALPTVSGVTKDGRTITAKAGTWTGLTPISFAYQWQSCNGSGESCTNLGSPTTETKYTLGPENIGHTLRVAVTGSNEATHEPDTPALTATSAATTVVEAIKPSNAALPTISGTAKIGKLLTASDGSWEGSPATYAYQWKSCNSVGGACSNISGATGKTFRIENAQLIHSIRVTVTATNSAGSASASSEPTASVNFGEPTNVSPPTVAGTAEDEQTLTGSAGEWAGSGTISYSYQWQRCNSEGESCTDISGAEAAGYAVQPEDVGDRLRVVVTATSAYGTTTEASAPTAPVAPSPPANTESPTIGGTAQVGETLTASPGAWNGTPPISYSYQWQRCDAEGEACTDIEGATEAEYALTEADAEATVRAVVTVTNAGGSESTPSAPTEVISAGTPPSNVSPPTITGTPKTYFTLTADPGTWEGAPPLTYAYQWQRCDAEGKGCADIEGATEAEYEIGEEDVGATLRVEVSASNGAGSAEAASAITEVVGSTSAPVNVSAPTISGTAAESEELTATHGTWVGPPTITYLYQWQACDAAGENCEDIFDAVESTYRVDMLDVRGTIRVVVTATNSEGSTRAASASTAVIGASAPHNDLRTALSGVAEAGQTLTASARWSGSAPISYTYQWERCESAEEGCTEIPGATGASYTAGYEDVGDRIRAEITATNEAGSASSTSVTTAVVAAAGWIDALDLHMLGENTELRSPASVTIAPDKSIWVIEGANDLAVHLTPSGGYAGSFGLFFSPGSIAVDAHSHVWVSRSAEGKVLEYSESGELLGHVSGSGLERPGAVAIDEAGNLWVGDGHAHKVFEFDEHGSFVRSIGSSGTGPGQFGEPVAIAFTPGGNVAVLDRTNNRVELYTKTGEYVSQFGGEGTGAGKFKLPQGIAIDGAGHVFVSDTGNNRVEELSAEGEFLDQFGVHGSASGELEKPTGIAIDAHRHVWLSDQGNERVEEWLHAVAASAETVPSISGEAAPGGVLSAGPGTWAGDPEPSYAFQWQSCTAEGGGCENITGATERSYEVQSADLGRTLRVRVTASNLLGPVSAVSAPSEAIAAASAPENTTAPSLAGEAREGRTLTAEPGSWSGAPAPTYSYQWQSCEPDGTECEDIEAATGSSYTPGSGDLGATVRVLVTAANVAGAAEASSSASEVVQAGAPSELEGPSLSGSSTVGEILSGSAGDWAGDEGEVAYQWQRCDAAGRGCEDIAGATVADYEVSSADLASTLRLEVGVHNPLGSAAARSEASGVVGDAGTVANTLAPTVSGTPSQGATLTASAGSWIGMQELGFEYRWQRCDAFGNNCHDVAGALGSSYVPTGEDAGSTLRAVVTAAEAEAASDERSLPTSVIAASEAPVAERPPSLSGTPLVGYTLTAAPGEWSAHGKPTLSYQWERCDAYGEGCEAIGSATTADYTLAEADAGSTLRVLVSATDQEGRVTHQASDPLLVSSDELESLAAPALGGLFTLDREATGTPGIWTGDGAIEFAYQWERCDETGEACSPLAGATEPAYTAGEEDIGYFLRLAVSATGSAGSASANSPLSPAIGDEPVAPETTSRPTIEGGATLGQTLTVQPGAWLSSEAISYAYQWERCTEEGESCVAIEGAEGESYELVEADVGTALKVRVTATNELGSASADSEETEPVDTPGPPEVDEPPLLSGTAQVGEKLVAGRGEWAGSRPASFAWRWQRCNAAGESCADIEGAVKSAYEPTSGDVGQTLRVVVIATNSLGSAEAASGVSEVVVAAGEADPTAAIEAAETADPSVLAPSTEATIEEQAVHPAIGDSGEQLSSTGALGSSWSSKDTPGEGSVYTRAGAISLAPVEPATGATTLPTVVNEAAAVYANVHPDTDTIVRPSALGSTSLVQLRSSSAPTSISWELGLTPEERLVKLSDGSVAVVQEQEAEEEEASFAARFPHSEFSTGEEGEGGEAERETAFDPAPAPGGAASRPAFRLFSTLSEGEEAPEGEAEEEEEPTLSEPLPPSPQVTVVTGEGAPGELEPQNTQAGYEHAQEVFVEAEADELEPVMVLDARRVRDASGDPVPVLLSIEGETVTMTVSPSAEAVYPLTAELAASGSSGEEIATPSLMRMDATASAASTHTPKFGLWEPHADQLEEAKEEEKVVAHFDKRLRSGPLHIGTARLVVPFNTKPDDPGVHEWVSVARKEGLEPFITISDDCNPACPLPDLKTYGHDVRGLMQGFPAVKIWGAWNEPDNPRFPMHPLKRAPKAAYFWQVARREAHAVKCGCKVIAGEFTEFVNNEELHENYIHIYVDTILKHHRYWKGNPTYWGMHDYQDLSHVNQKHPIVTTAAHKFLALSGKLNHPHMWMTEGGVPLDVGGHPTALEARHCKYPTTGRCKNQQLSAKDFITLSSINEDKGKVHFDRSYYAQYRGPTTSQLAENSTAFDSALLEGKDDIPGPKGEEKPDLEAATWRPAYCMLAFASHKCPPGAVTHPPQGAKAKTSRVGALVEPRELATSAWLEYGESEAYGHTTSRITVPAGSAAETRSFALQGLTPCTTYHYQVEAENEASEGIPTLGGDETFTTSCEGEGLSQDWENGMESEVPSSEEVDPHTGQPDAWLLEEVAAERDSGDGGPSFSASAAGPSSAGVSALARRSRGARRKSAAAPFALDAPDLSEETSGNLWHVQDHPSEVSVNGAISPGLVTLPDDGSLPSARSGTHVAWFGDPASGTFCLGYASVLQEALNGCKSSTTAQGALVSPPFSLEGADSAVLHFKSWFDIEAVQPNEYDTMKIEYTTSSGSGGGSFAWHKVAKLNPGFRSDGSESDRDFTNNGLSQAPSWTDDTVALPGAAGSPHARIRFVFNSGDDNYNGFRGWVIDDVHVVGQQELPAPHIDSVTPCPRAGWTHSILHGSNFVEGSSALVDGFSGDTNVISSERIEIPELRQGTHTIKVVDPDGETTSNTVSVTQSAACEKESIS
ncbi:MAG TPA: LamG-like jellyroll fold domain-containing protein [Solirubrobacteraceae bacterium]|nr:LamG-like jellyroll fold domain-containing protein [Solirubrobacteraceae bacterium]